MKNILKNVKSNSFILGIIGSVIGGALFLSILPLARFFWKLLFSWSNRFSRLIIDSTIRKAIKDIRDINLVDLLTFVGVFFIIVVVIMIATDSVKFKSNTKKQSGEKISEKRYIMKNIIFKFTLLFVLVCTVYFVDSTVEALNSIQKLRMGIIAPYITDQKEEELWSKWYLMKSKIDYINFNSELDNIAENNKIELPKAYY